MRARLSPKPHVWFDVRITVRSNPKQGRLTLGLTDAHGNTHIVQMPAHEGYQLANQLVDTLEGAG